MTRHPTWLFVPLLALTGTASGQKRAQFDFGIGALAPGHEQVDSDTATGTTAGWSWGWHATPSDYHDRGVIPLPDPLDESTAHALALSDTVPPELVVDSAAGPDMTFRLQGVAAGSYWVAVQLGDIGDIGDLGTGPTPVEGVEIRVNGSTYRSGVFARTQTVKGSLDDTAGGTRHVAFRVDQLTPGPLDVQVIGAQGDASWQGLEVIEIRAGETPPIVFDHQLPGLVMDPAGTSARMRAALTDVVTALNTGDGQAAFAAVTAAVNTANPNRPKQRLEAAWAQAWLVGWLVNWADATTTGYQEGCWRVRDEEVLTELRAELTLLASDPVIQDSADLVALRHDVEAYAKGRLFAESRGYTPTVYNDNPESRGSLKFNIWTAVQLFEQVDGDVLDGAAAAGTFCQALYPKSLYQLAHMFLAQNTRINTGAAFADANQYWVPMFLSLYAALDPWDEAQSVPLAPLFRGPDIFTQAAYVLVTNCINIGINNGGCSSDGTSEDLLNDLILPDVMYMLDADNGRHYWWESEVALPDALPGIHSPPAWAEVVREVVRYRYNAGTWWMNHRKLTDPTGTILEFGGGSGDDPELARGFGVLASLLRQEGGDLLETDLLAFSRSSVDGPEVDPIDRYYAGFNGCSATDIEHGTEHTHDNYTIASNFTFGSPFFVEAAMATVRNVDEDESDCPPNNGDWTTPAFVHPNARHFRSFKPGANWMTIPQGNQHDTTWSSRLLEPALELSSAFRLPGARARLESVAAGWYLAATFDDPEKPKGALPAAVDAVNGALSLGDFGDGSDAFAMPPGYNVMIAKPKGKTLAAWYRIFVLLSRHSASPPPGGTSPADWLEPLAAALAWLDIDPDHEQAGIHRGALSAPVFDAREELEAYMMNGQLVDDFLVAQMNDYDAYFSNEALDCGMKQGIVDELSPVAEAMRYYYPLLTSFAVYTDRLLIDPSLIDEVLTGNGLVTWYDSEPGAAGDLDVAVLVSRFDRDTNYLEALVYNFGTDRDLGLQFSGAFGPGIYRVRGGPAAPNGNCEDGLADYQWTSSAVSGPFELRGPGERVDIELVSGQFPPKVLPAGQLTRLRITNTGCIPDPQDPDECLDLSVDRMDLAISNEDVDTLAWTITVHNLGAADHVSTQNGAVIEFRQSGSTTEVVPITDLLAAGTALQPVVAVLTLPALGPGQWEVEIVTDDLQPDLTRANNSLMVTIP